MSETVFIIDGMYMLFSSFYAYPNMKTLKGEPTGAIFGFINRTESLIKELNPKRIAVAFDCHEKTFRHHLYEPYKAKRLETPEALLQQVPHVREYLQLRGIDLFEIPGFEADDIIASFATREAQKGNEVVIFSGDKDLFQLVSGSTYIYHPKLKQKLDTAGITEVFGVAPGQIVDYLSLTGDSSDNIPGVPGIGEKTAKKIIDTYGSIHNMLTHLDQVEEKIRKKIKDNMDSLELSRKLIDLAHAPHLDHELPVQVFHNNIGNPLLDFFRKLSFSSLLNRFEGSTKAVPEKEAPGLDILYHVVKDTGHLQELAARIRQEGYFAFDLETTALTFFQAEIIGISISFSTDGYYIPFLCAPAEKNEISFHFDDFKRELSPLFADATIKKIGHNLKFDILHLRHHGVMVQGVSDDSVIMSYLNYPNRRAHGLKDLTLELLQFKQARYEELAGKGKEQKQLFTVDLDTLSRYCINDSYLALKLVDVLGKEIEAKSLTHLYRTIEIPLMDVLIAMEYVGVKLDVDFLKRSAKVLADKIHVLEQEIFGIIGYPINLNSPQQLGELLFEKMQLPIQKKTRKTKTYSTDIEVLNELNRIEYPIVGKIILYRTYKKLLSTYLEGLLECVDGQQRVHSSFNQTVTATGRLSSSDPNLQNIPVGETGGVTIREAFIADTDKWILSADYSQVELRVMAHFSQDPNLLEAFKNDFDIHQHTANTVFGGDLFATPQEKRKRAKIINFSVIYGTGPYSLSKELEVSYQEARDFIDTYFEKNAGVKRFVDEVIARAEQEPEVRTISGRRRDIPEITSSNRTVKENGQRMAINTIIQGSAADIIKVAMINIYNKMQVLGMHSQMIMQVHDELVFEYLPAEEEQLFKLVKREMENAIPLSVPLKVVLKKGKNWGTMTEVVSPEHV